MTNKELHIDHIKQYIRGELTASESLLIEKQLVESQMWQDIYEGLLVAEQLNIDTKTHSNSLEKELDITLTKQTSKVFPLRTYFTGIAAALVILGFAYFTIIFINQAHFSSSEQAILEESSPKTPTNQLEKDYMTDTYDQIEIIESSSNRSDSESQVNESIQWQKQLVKRFSKATPVQLSELEIIPYPSRAVFAKMGYYQIRQFTTQFHGPNAEINVQAELATIISNAKLNQPNHFKNQCKRVIANDTGTYAILFTVSYTGNPEGITIREYEKFSTANKIVRLLEQVTFEPAMDENNMPNRQEWELLISEDNMITLQYKS